MPGKRNKPISDRQAAHLERLRSERVKHGLCDHPLYAVWLSMRRRCEDERSKAFKNYGARGVRVCEQWAEFAAFFGWANNNGWSRGLHLDRIDTNGDYGPHNCRFVTQAVNNRNRRNTLPAELAAAIRAVSGTHAEAARQFGVGRTVASRVRRGNTYPQEMNK